MLIAGIRAINPADQPIWTYTQFLTGWPMLVANIVEKNNRDSLEKMYTSGEYVASRPGVSDPQNDPAQQAKNDERRKEQAEAYFPAHPIITYHPKVQDMGAGVYCGIAGMLNLLVMFDVLLRITGSVREDPAAQKKQMLATGPNSVMHPPEARHERHASPLCSPLAFSTIRSPASFRDMDNYWLWLVVPLVIAISVVYKCTRINSLRPPARRGSLIMSAQILIVMVLAAGALWAISYAYVRIIAHWG